MDHINSTHEDKISDRSLKGVIQLFNKLIDNKSFIKSRSYTSANEIVSCKLDELVDIGADVEFKTWFSGVYRRKKEWKDFSTSQNICISNKHPLILTMPAKKILKVIKLNSITHMIYS